MNGMLPENLRIPAPADPEVSEDFRELLEKVIEQNAEILELLDDDCAETPSTFWESAFSIWGLLIVIVICAMLTQIYSGTPLFE